MEEYKDELGIGTIFELNGILYVITQIAKIKIPLNEKDGEICNFMIAISMHNNDETDNELQLFIGSIDADGNPNAEIYDDEWYVPYVAGKLTGGLTEEELEGFLPIE